jgi:hypothetical protein
MPVATGFLDMAQYRSDRFSILAKSYRAGRSPPGRWALLRPAGSFGSLLAPQMAGGMLKAVGLREEVRLRFEPTFTNLPNHPNFAALPVDVSASATFLEITTVHSADNSCNQF